VGGRIPLASKELLLMRAILNSMLAFAVIDIDAVQAVGVYDNKTLIAAEGVRAGLSGWMP
jgi:hypothetical protein